MLLTREIEETLSEYVASGQFASKDAALEAALALLREHTAETTALRIELQRRIDEADRGELLEPEEVFSALRERARMSRPNAA